MIGADKANIVGIAVRPGRHFMLIDCRPLTIDHVVLTDPVILWNGKFIGGNTPAKTGRIHSGKTLKAPLIIPEPVDGFIF